MKIAFIHSKCKPFRIDFFKAIEKKYDIDFFFYDENKGNLKNFNEIIVKKIPCLSDFYYAKDLEGKLRGKEYDIYVSTDLGYHITHIAYKVSKEKGKKFILWNEQWKDIKHPRRFLMRGYENKIVKGSSAILAFGNKSKSFLIDRGANECRIVKTPNAVPSINSIEFSSINMEDRYPVNLKEKFNILCIARLIPVKGQEYLIKAIKKLVNNHPNIHLIIAGEGPMYKKLSKLIKNLNLENYVTIPGISVGEMQKWDLYSNVDLVILPSVYTRHAEAWGLVVNEAAMLSKCIITTDMTGVDGEIIRNGYSGVVVNEKDIEELASSIDKLISDDSLRDSYGKKAKLLVDSEYTIEKMVECFDRAIEISMS